MSTLEKAIQIAAAAHAGTFDKQEQPYILHPIRVMLNVQGETAQMVAILHDVVEDTDTTLQDLKQEGFSDEVLTALDLVTHKEDQTYADYVVACKPNSIARQVKLADLTDNANLSRVLFRPAKLKKDTRRVQRYVLSHQYLKDEITEAEYREAMSNQS